MSVIILYTNICLTQYCKVLMMVYNVHIQASSYGLCASCNIYKNTKALTFQKPALLPSSGKKLIICWAHQIKLFSVMISLVCVAVVPSDRIT